MVTCESPNVKVLGINGNFDDCQRIVKSLLSDQVLKKKLLKNHSVVLNTANSINWGRILPQILFHMVCRAFNLHKLEVFMSLQKHSFFSMTILNWLIADLLNLDKKLIFVFQLEILEIYFHQFMPKKWEFLMTKLFVLPMITKFCMIFLQMEYMIFVTDTYIKQFHLQ